MYPRRIEKSASVKNALLLLVLIYTACQLAELDWLVEYVLYIAMYNTYCFVLYIALLHLNSVLRKMKVSQLVNLISSPVGKLNSLSSRGICLVWTRVLRQKLFLRVS